MKYLKWVFGTKIAKKENQNFKLNEVIEADTWDPYNDDWDKRGGFNFTNVSCALRWISRGDTLYEVEIPEDAEVVDVKNDKTPGGIFIANKIILKNPIPISEELILDCYDKSKLPESTYFECIGILAFRGYYNIALKIIEDKVNMNNIDLAIEKYKRALKPWHEGNVDRNSYDKCLEVLEEIKSDININLFIDKKPFIKEITKDKVINITGESGSGKSTYCEKYKDNDKYIIVDTDIIFKDKIIDNKDLEGLRKIFIGKPKDYIITNFDDFYLKTLEYFKYSNKTIVIDSAQYRNINDISILKGKLIIIRTSINTCYKRLISRYKKLNKNYTTEELDKYMERKRGIYSWYKTLNILIKNIDNLQ